MGRRRLDEHAKRRIVELRRAGLSFRRIKEALELDDIRVTSQAVYLFLKRKSMKARWAAAGGDGHQPRPPRQGQEAEPPRLLGTGSPAVPLEVPCSPGSQDTMAGIQIVSVVSLCKDEGQLGDTLPMELAPGNGGDSSTGTPLALGDSATLPQPLPGPEWPVTPHSRNPALMVPTGTVNGAVVLEKKVKDASTQTALLNPVGPENHSLAWGVPVPPCAPSSQAIAEKLGAVQTEVQKLNRALHMVLERQCRLERQQEQQQRLQREVLMTLQQLSSTVSHGAMPANQPCVPFSSVAEPSPAVPNFSQFKIELI